MAIDYKILKNCMRCKKRFSVKKGQSKIQFCTECQPIVNAENARRDAEEEAAEKEAAAAKK